MFRVNYVRDFFEFHISNCLYFLKIKKRFKDDSNNSCPYCGSCGIAECCRPTRCINHPKGHYCKYYQDVYKVSDLTLTEFWNEVHHNKQVEVENKLSEIYFKHFKEIFYKE